MTETASSNRSAGHRSPPRASAPNPGAMQPISRADERAFVFDAVSSFDVTKTAAWDELSRLSANTLVDTIDAVPEGIFKLGTDRFTAVATVYVDLTYGEDGEAYTVANNFPMIVNGHFDPKEGAVVDTAEVNTSSFYE